MPSSQSLRISLRSIEDFASALWRVAHQIANYLHLYQHSFLVKVPYFDLPIIWFYPFESELEYLYPKDSFWGRCCQPCNVVGQQLNHSKREWADICYFLVASTFSAYFFHIWWSFPQLYVFFPFSSHITGVTFRVIHFF